MTTDELVLQLLLVPALIALNAFFVAAEYAVVAVRSAHIEQLRRAGSRRSADAMQRIRERPAAAIGAIQVCITMTNLLLGWIGEPAMTTVLRRSFRPLVEAFPTLMASVSVALGFLIVTLLTVVFSELLPKALTLQRVPQVARLTARPILGVLLATRPLVWLMNATAHLITRPLGLGRVDAAIDRAPTAEDIRLTAIEAAADGIITPRERSLILNTLVLGRRTAQQIMVPRTRVAYLDLQRSMRENFEVAEQYLFSRMPLCNGGMDHIVGLLPTREFLSAYNAAGDTSVLQLLVRPAVFAPERIALDRLLALFHEHRTQFIFLADEHGGVEGIVTLRDVVDELLGESSPAPVVAADEPFEAPGDMPVHELAARLGKADWAAERSAVTVGGLVTELLGRIPQAGETITHQGITLTVVEADTRAVRRVTVIRE